MFIKDINVTHVTDILKDILPTDNTSKQFMKGKHTFVKNAARLIIISHN